jgi:hypothetical protein
MEGIFMSTSRRNFLLGSGTLVSGVWSNPAGAHNLPTGKAAPLYIPRAPRTIYAYPQLGTSTNSMLLCMGKYQPDIPYMTWREYLIQEDYELASEAQIKEAAREFAVEPDWLDVEIVEINDLWEPWVQASNPNARAYRFLTKLNLGADLEWIHWRLKPRDFYLDRRDLDFSFHQIGGPFAYAAAGFERRNGRPEPTDTREGRGALYFRDRRAGHQQIEESDGTSLEMLQARLVELKALSH